MDAQMSVDSRGDAAEAEEGSRLFAPRTCAVSTLGEISPLQQLPGTAEVNRVPSETKNPYFIENDFVIFRYCLLPICQNS